jgi:stringent starvation protein B
MVDFPNGQKAYAQVDFEFLEFENNKPTEWAKFSHSSSFDDAKINVKAVHHKYLIRALIGAASIREDIVIATQSSTPENITLSANKTHLIPKMLKFSVGKGIRIAYEPLIDPKTGKVIVLDGKQVYKEIPTKNSTYETIVAEIYKLSFKQLNSRESDVKLFGSFIGVIELMKKFLSKNEIKNTYIRYVELIWGLKPQRAQELEFNNAELDFQIKFSGYQKFIKEFGMKDESVKLAEEYYKDYGQRGKIHESFRDYLRSL